MTYPKKILFLCTGNICRSPMAEAYLRKLLVQGGPSDVEVFSAGGNAIDGNVTPREGIETASQIGLSLAEHRAKQLDGNMATYADKILVMAPEHAEFIHSSFPEAENKTEFLAHYSNDNNSDIIPDPLGGSEDDYRDSYHQIAEAVQAFYQKTFPQKDSTANRISKDPNVSGLGEAMGVPAHQGGVQVTVPASAANLGPGYDTLGIALQLYNRVTLESAEQDEVLVFGEGEDSLPCDTTNIVFQAIETTFLRLGIERPPLRVTLENAIPLARGLGSSAAARIGGLFAARSWCQLDIDSVEVLRQAETLEGHADNAAPSLLGGLTIVAGKGESLRFAHAPISDKIQISLAIPEFEVSTPEARNALPKTIPHDHAVFNVQRTALLIMALTEGNKSLLPTATEDRLHQTHRAHLMGPIKDAFSAARNSGADGVALSGAGPTVLAFSIAGEADAQMIAEDMADAYRARDIGCRPLTLKIDFQGARCELAG